MSRFSVETLKKDWHRKRGARLSSLTPGIAGKIAACVLILEQGGEHISSDAIEEVFVDNLSEAPEALRKVLHLDVSVTGISLREHTEMILGVQHAEIVGRLNPGYGELYIKYNYIEDKKAKTKVLLQGYRKKFPEIVEWISNQVQKKKTPVELG